MESPGAQPSSGNLQFIEGLLDYHLDQFSAAVGKMRLLATQQRPSSRNIQAHAVAAMAKYQLKDFEGAERSLEEGVRALDKASGRQTESAFEEWNDWLIARLLLKQAQAVVETGASKPQ